MEQERILLKGSLSVTADAPRKKRSVWFWIRWQALAGILAIGITNGFHIRSVYVLPFQWTAILAILYWQIRSSPLEGMQITVQSGFVSKWNIIRICGSDMLGIVYRTAVGRDGSEEIRAVPFYPSRYRIVSYAKFHLLRFAVWARIIQ